MLPSKVITVNIAWKLLPVDLYMLIKVVQVDWYKFPVDLYKFYEHVSPIQKKLAPVYYVKLRLKLLLM